MQNVRIIVVGAGISGISAASRLLENGFKNVIILEAEKRIGGRVNTSPFANNVVDLGAQWCHGEKNNVVYELVKDHQVLDYSNISFPSVNFLDSNGQLIDSDLCGRLIALCMSILENSSDDLADYTGSLGSYTVKKYKEELTTSEFSDIDNETSLQVLDYFQKYENSIEASDSWFETSGNGYLHYWECEGHPLLNWKDKGYKTVIDYITKKKPDPRYSIEVEKKILLNKEVSHIEWRDPQVKIKCSDGSFYDADHVIVTTSLGVLKENYKTLFNPQLPKKKIDAIKGLSFGTVDKIFLEFEKPFWNDEWKGFSLLWKAKDSEEIRNTSDAWMEDVFGFYVVDFQPNILCGWISGKSARKMETLDDETVLRSCMKLFTMFLGSRLPWTTPINILRSNWYTNKHFRGSYSFRSMTTNILETSACALARPLQDPYGKPVLLFAGEATSEHYYSTVHGAVEAGWREAARLTEFYQSSTTNKTKKFEVYDVIVLGGGLAGLGAGKVLKEANVKFMILEGQDRVGGRINTVTCSKSKNGEEIRVDSGAQWLHGKNNELFKFAEKCNLIHDVLSEEAEGDYIREDGMKFDEYFVKKIDFKIGQILEECEALVELKNVEGVKFPASLEEYLTEKFTDFVENMESNEEKELAYQLLDWHKRFQIIDNACMKFNEISAKCWGNYSFNGESCQTHINVKGGMSEIVDKLKTLLEKNFRLNQNVQLIHWKNDQQPGIVVLCKDGSKYVTNRLICTFSLGVLKESHLELFSPSLPTAQQEAIEAIGYGTINKIFLHFKQKWWNDDWKGLQLIWKTNNNSHWTNYISGFDVINSEPKNTLLGWIGGQGAIDIEKLSDEDIIAECMKLLRKFIKRENLPEPDDFYCSRWNQNKFIRGAYSFTSTKCDHLQNWEKTLSKPIIFDCPENRKNVILLAGEACHEQYFSTVHGAFLSGIEQAENILKLDRSSSISKL
ncbi:CLUMA_CG018144, isoform A [Clunio marinus]|uniref:CLUMA_CG018144, isoform A n=1 Tax=Clunio marinus TaxID=568069 RepID=A0A1J1IYZ4_9DIPT|nr:CLUMA_CG018144, isoform A [Clunio marinus]